MVDTLILIVYRSAIKIICMRIKYTKELLEENIKNCYSFAELARRLGLKPEGSNPKTLKKKLIEFNVDFSHFTGQGWNRPEHPKFGCYALPLESILTTDSKMSSYNIKKRLFNNNIKKKQCEICGITEWNGKEITFQLHHINGNNEDNRLENLQILCPNCHSQTDNFCKRFEIR